MITISHLCFCFFISNLDVDQDPAVVEFTDLSDHKYGSVISW